MNAHTLQVLQFGEALALVARRAATTLGAATVRSLRPSTELATVQAELARVQEWIALLDRLPDLGVPALPDIREALGRLAIERTVLDAGELRGAGTLLASSRTLRRALLREGSAAPLTAEIAAGLIERDADEVAIDAAIDTGGELRDDASAELVRLRRELRTLRGRLVQRLEAFVASLPPEYQVSDASITVRDGRYVVPIRREGRSLVGGVVHDESATGATLFVEPPAALEAMNRLRELEAAEAREIARILRDLTDRLRPSAAELAWSLALLVRLDSLAARGRYARDTDGHVPVLLPAGTAEHVIVDGRHPLLLATEGGAVPFSLQMDPDERTLVISCPNTGGKTVLLKTVGLVSLLAQAGVVPPVGAHTRIPLFRGIFADIGDEQSIEASLSTFSGHLRNLGEVLGHADAESLVLADEMGSGTDPVEGAAIARAVLLDLVDRRCRVVATTHLGQLKLLATEVPGVVNASLQFDAERLRPTYRLLKGIPGRSYGIAIARRLGLPAAVLDEAERSLPAGERVVARLLLDLERKEVELTEGTVDLARAQAEVARLREQLADREANLVRRERSAEQRTRQQARDLLLAARREVEQAIAELRGAAEQVAEGKAAALDDAVRAARRRVEDAAKRQRERADAKPAAAQAAPPRGAVPLAPGVRVRIASLGTVGVVQEIRDGKARVETGGLRLLLPADDLAALPAGDQAPSKNDRPRPAPPAYGGTYNPGDEARPEVDLRGFRVDEIDGELGRALDAALMSGLPRFRIIHGKGTGALREQVQSLLRRDPRIATARPGERDDGGTGVTVVEFA